MADTRYEPGGKRLARGGSRSSSPVDSGDYTVYESITEFLNELMSLKEGEVYVGLDATYYNTPHADWKKMRDVSKNHLITEQMERLTSLLFIDRPKIEALDEEGNPDEDVSRELQVMCDAKPVAKDLDAVLEALARSAEVEEKPVCVVPEALEQPNSRALGALLGLLTTKEGKPRRVALAAPSVAWTDMLDIMGVRASFILVDDAEELASAE